MCEDARVPPEVARWLETMPWWVEPVATSAIPIVLTLLCLLVTTWLRRRPTAMPVRVIVAFGMPPIAMALAWFYRGLLTPESMPTAAFIGAVLTMLPLELRERSAPPWPAGVLRAMVALTLFIVVVFGARVGLAALERRTNETTLRWVFALTGGHVDTLDQLGMARYLAHDIDGAAEAFEAASALEPEVLSHDVYRARVFLGASLCERALDTVFEVSARAGDQSPVARELRGEFERCRSSARGTPD